MGLARSSARGPDGSLAEYVPLLRALERHGLVLSTDGAGTRLATLDVSGSVTFPNFLHCLSMRDAPEPPAAPP